MKSDPVLFVSHDASRTGAPMVLLHFLRWVSSNTDLAFEILLAADGDLRQKFEALGRPVSVLPREPLAGKVDLLVQRIRRRRILQALRRSRGLIVSNTVTSGLLIDALSQGRRPVVSYIHELETTIRATGTANLQAVLRQTTAYVACCEAVKANLVKRHGVAAGSIEVVHEFVPIPAPVNTSSEHHHAVRNEIGIPPGAFVVCASGTTDWRKGADLFCLLARAVIAKRPAMPVHFVWIGGANPGSARYRELEHDISLLGLNGRVHFMGVKRNPLDYFRAIDVFALMSREDPYPLVCLEAASLGKPLLCFAGAGGEPEFVEEDCGFVAPYLDIDGMANQLLRLLDSEELRRKMGTRAGEKVRERHDVTVGAPGLFKVIDRCRQSRTQSASL